MGRSRLKSPRIATRTRPPSPPCGRRWSGPRASVTECTRTWPDAPTTKERRDRHEVAEGLGQSWVVFHAPAAESAQATGGAQGGSEWQCGRGGGSSCAWRLGGPSACTSPADRPARVERCRGGGPGRGPGDSSGPRQGTGTQSQRGRSPGPGHSVTLPKVDRQGVRDQSSAPLL